MPSGSGALCLALAACGLLANSSKTGSSRNSEPRAAQRGFGCLTAVIERMAPDCYWHDCWNRVGEEVGGCRNRPRWALADGGVPETTIIEDIANDHRFGAARDFASKFGLRAGAYPSGIRSRRWRATRP